MYAAHAHMRVRFTNITTSYQFDYSESKEMRLCIRLLQQSSYSVGLAYELLVMEVLERYSFQLKHTGGAGDGGQDFNGYWVLPEKRVPVVGEQHITIDNHCIQLNYQVLEMIHVLNLYGDCVHAFGGRGGWV